MLKTVLYQTIQFSISTQFYLTHRSDPISCYQSGPRSKGNKEVLCILQRTSITGASLSDCLVSYPGYSLGESYPPVEMKLMYSTAPVDKATPIVKKIFVSYFFLSRDTTYIVFQFGLFVLMAYDIV